MDMPKSRDIRAKMPSPKVISNAFLLVTVKVLNSYNYFITGKGSCEGPEQLQADAGKKK